MDTRQKDNGLQATQNEPIDQPKDNHKDKGIKAELTVEAEGNKNSKAENGNGVSSDEQEGNGTAVHGGSRVESNSIEVTDALPTITVSKGNPDEAHYHMAKSKRYVENSTSLAQDLLDKKNRTSMPKLQGDNGTDRKGVNADEKEMLRELKAKSKNQETISQSIGSNHGLFKESPNPGGDRGCNRAKIHADQEPNGNETDISLKPVSGQKIQREPKNELTVPKDEEYTRDGRRLTMASPILPQFVNIGLADIKDDKPIESVTTPIIEQGLTSTDQKVDREVVKAPIYQAKGNTKSKDGAKHTQRIQRVEATSNLLQPPLNAEPQNKDVDKESTPEAKDSPVVEYNKDAGSDPKPDKDILVNEMTNIENAVPSEELTECRTELQELNSILMNFVDHAKSLKSDPVLASYDVVPNPLDLSADNKPSKDIGAYERFHCDYHKNLQTVLATVSSIVDELCKRGHIDQNDRQAPGQNSGFSLAKLQKLSECLFSAENLVKFKVISQTRELDFDQTDDIEINNDKQMLGQKVSGILKTLQESMAKDDEKVEKTFEEFKASILRSDIIKFSQDERKYIEIFFCLMKIKDLLEKDLTEKPASKDKLKRLEESFSVVKKIVEMQLKEDYNKDPKNREIGKDFAKIYQRETDEIMKLTNENTDLKADLAKSKAEAEAKIKELTELKVKYEAEVKTRQEEQAKLTAELTTSNRDLEVSLAENVNFKAKVASLEDNMTAVRGLSTSLLETNKSLKSFEERIKEKDSEIARLIGNIAEMNSALSVNSAELDKAKNIIANNDLKIEDLNRRHKDGESNVRKLREKLDKLKTESKSRSLLEDSDLTKTVLMTDTNRNRQNLVTTQEEETLKKKIEQLMEKMKSDKIVFERTKKELNAKVSHIQNTGLSYIQQIKEFQNAELNYKKQIKEFQNANLEQETALRALRTSGVKLITTSTQPKGYAKLLLVGNMMFLLIVWAYILHTRTC